MATDAAPTQHRLERATATKCRIADLLNGQHIMRDGTRPSGVLTPLGEVVRVNLVGAIVAKTGNATILLDDGSGQIEARAFDDERLFARAAPGTIALIIGRPRQHQGQAYVVAEICKTLASPKWLELRQTELGRALHAHATQPRPASAPTHIPAQRQEPVKQDRKEETKTADIKKNAPIALEKKNPVPEETITLTADRILEIIRSLDDGGGAPIEKVVAKAGRADAETLVTNLLAEGEIFEIRPGRVKVLE